MISTVSVPPAAIVVLLAWTVAPLPCVADHDHCRALALELLVSVIAHMLAPLSVVVQGAEPSSTLVGLTEIVGDGGGGDWTVRVTSTVWSCPPMMNVMLSVYVPALKSALRLE